MEKLTMTDSTEPVAITLVVPAPLVAPLRAGLCDLYDAEVLSPASKLVHEDRLAAFDDVIEQLAPDPADDRAVLVDAAPELLKTAIQTRLLAQVDRFTTAIERRVGEDGLRRELDTVGDWIDLRESVDFVVYGGLQ